MSQINRVKVLTYRKRPFVPLPSYAQDGDGGADLTSAHYEIIPPKGGRKTIGTGLHLAIPEGYAGFIQSRSGLAIKHNVTCFPGLIDSGYRGEIRVMLINDHPTDYYTVSTGDRIAQLVIQQVTQGIFEEVEELPDSQRGVGGFGSTGK